MKTRLVKAGALLPVMVVMLSALTISHFAFAQSAEANGTASARALPANISSDPYADCPVGDDGAYVQLTVTGLKDAEGNVRVQVYNDKAEEFLGKGKKLSRIDVRARLDETEVCVGLPGPGRYALIVMHDRNANGRADFLTEGFGFSNNPKLGFGPPDHADVVIPVDRGVKEMQIELTYIFQLDDKRRERRKRRR